MLKRVPLAIWLMVGLALGLLLLLLALMWMNEGLRKPSTFSLSARTEVAELDTTDLTSNRWYLPKADVVLGRGSPLELDYKLDRLEGFSGFVDIGPRVRVRIERPGSGLLQLTLDDAQGGDGVLDPEAPISDSRRVPVVSLQDLSGEKAALHTADSAYLEVPAGRLPLNWSLIGIGALGNEVHLPAQTEAAPLLLSGNVVMMARRLFSDLLYPVMQVDLVLGDEVRVRDAQGQPVEQTCVFRMAGKTEDDSPGLEVACQAHGRTLEISRYGKRVDRLEPDPWDVLINEPTFLAVFPLFIAALFGLVQWVLLYALRGFRLPGKNQE